ncbi:TRAF-type zinc finger domain-containing protein 1 isoform X2 [Suricata suricatta]|uniref:TRAF-type zinc finger domain-containing protein 1 isoform X2 n=1 Tax=Suricata suricatta TaxID=37032 RepID=UPI001155A852|nr:TRAF-type zinc finger domain-containing protein 1 isoform X2 [Suricata suricatta]XP_029777328.1 TRAF-type zinc finger domain-containing protein 1 isoform X2 [Suricata suricatta]
MTRTLNCVIIARKKFLCLILPSMRSTVKGTLVTCKCNKKLEKRQLKKHEETECPLRLALCQHCDLELSLLKLKDHEDYCGARTELCGSCGRNVLVKDLKTHPEVCGKDGEEKRNEVAMPPNAYDESWGQDRIWIASQLLRQIEALDPPTRLPRGPLRAYDSDLFPSRTTDQRNVTSHFPIQNNLLEEQERQERNRTRQPPKEGGEDGANLDFMLALSLQNEGQAHSMAEQDFWRAVCGAEQSLEGPSALNGIKGMADRTMLPCEFCEELYPEELLIDHQTSCNPSCALPSRSMGSTPPRGAEDPDAIFQKFLQQASSNQIDSLMGLSSSPPVEDSVIIPCEFCGVQLEEEVLFHHQDQCDQRPATANNHMTEGIPRQDFQHPETSAELPKRRVRHQGDLSSGYMDDIKQETAKGPTYPLPPRRPINNMTATCNRLSTSTSGSRPGCQPSPPRILKLNNLDSQDSRGRDRNSHNSAMDTEHAPVIHPVRSLYPENLVPSFPRGPSGRYGASGRSEGGRNSRVTSTTANYRNRTAKAKTPKQQGAGDAEEEEEEE